MATTKQKYYINNRDRIIEYQKNYYAGRSEEILANKRKEYADNIEDYRKKIECECGKTYTKKNKARHLKSTYHTKRVNQKEEPTDGEDIPKSLTEDQHQSDTD
jgi:hypothetical protein